MSFLLLCIAALVVGLAVTLSDIPPNWQIVVCFLAGIVFAWVVWR